MAVGLSAALANEINNALFRNSALTLLPNGAVWVKLHVGDPGAAGTANPAVETDRVQGTFGTNSASGLISNTAALTWAAVAGAEDYTHFSAWTASTGGTFLFSGTITANAVLVGDDFVIPIGDLDFQLGIAA